MVPNQATAAYEDLMLVDAAQGGFKVSRYANTDGSIGPVT